MTVLYFLIEYYGEQTRDNIEERFGSYLDFGTPCLNRARRGSCTYRRTRTHRAILQRLSKFLS